MQTTGREDFVITDPKLRSSLGSQLSPAEAFIFADVPAEALGVAVVPMESLGFAALLCSFP